MAHLVSIPPPANYQTPGLRELSVYDRSGTAAIAAWGLFGDLNDDHWCVGAAGTERVVSNIFRGDRPNLAKFNLRGLQAGDQLRIYLNTNYNVPGAEYLWTRYSEPVTVKYVQADRWAAAFKNGTLPKCKYNSKISYYPHGIQQRRPPISGEAWLKALADTFDKLCSSSLGRKIVQMVQQPLIVRPWIAGYPQATSGVLFTPHDWDKMIAPGARADEILLHELIHVVEGAVAPYQNLQPGFQFDEDFYTVNATNVYSCLLGRPLRKDHAGFVWLPENYFANPKVHFDDFKSNYAIAKGRNPALYALLAGSSNLWNPFRY